MRFDLAVSDFDDDIREARTVEQLFDWQDHLGWVVVCVPIRAGLEMVFGLRWTKADGSLLS